jgi:hypothetical protein
MRTLPKSPCRTVLSGSLNVYLQECLYQWAWGKKRSSDGQTYLAEITIDPDGSLRRPDLPPIETDSAITSLGHEIEIVIDEID